MIVFFDTNVLISSLLCKNSIPHRVILKSTDYPYFGVTSDYCLEELDAVIENKFPNRKLEMKKVLSEFLPTLNVVTTNDQAYDVESLLRDSKDCLVLRAALQIDADILITGDKDLLELKIEKPIIITPREFIDNY